jgi:hypothetical protein
MQYQFYAYLPLLTRLVLDNQTYPLWDLGFDHMKILERDILFYLEEQGIARAWSCEECDNIGSDGDGYEYNGTWSVCDRHEQFGYLKSFPFRRIPQRCRPRFVPSFWATSYAGLLDGEEENHDAAVAAWRARFCPEAA